jgi:hypothetical protein
MSTRFFIYLIVLLFIFLYGAFSFKKLGAPYRLLTLFIGATFISETISRVLIKKLHTSAPADHIFTVVEYLLISAIYFSLSKNALFKQALVIGMPLFVIAEVVNLIFYQTLFQFPSVLLSLQEMSCVIFSLVFFTEMLLNPIDIALFKQSAFWLNVSIFVFSATVFFCFGLMNSFVISHLGTTFLDTFVYGLNIFFYLFLGLSINIEVNNSINATK